MMMMVLIRGGDGSGEIVSYWINLFINNGYMPNMNTTLKSWLSSGRFGWSKYKSRVALDSGWDGRLKSMYGLNHNLI